MKKVEFMTLLNSKLKGLPKEDRKRILDYYSEIIDDKIENGDEEEVAVASVGSVEEIAEQSQREGETKKPKNKKSIALIIAGSPLWAPVLLAVLAVVLSAYIVFWSVIFSVAVTVVSLIISAPVAIVFAIISLFVGSAAQGFMVFGIGLMVFGVGLIALFPTLKLVKLSALITKKSVLTITKSMGGRRV